MAAFEGYSCAMEEATANQKGDIKKRAIRAIVRLTGLIVLLSVILTHLLQRLTPHPNYLIGAIMSALAPAIIVPLVAYRYFVIINELRQAKREIEILSNTDPLTGIHNRRHLFDLMENALRLAERQQFPTAVFMLYLDQFKTVNDRYGHQAGDEVLVETARRVSHVIRETDIFGRYGGEEFLIVSPFLDEAHMIDLGERVRRSICEQPFQTAAGPIHVSVSIGAANTLHQGYAVEALIHEADQRLYESKRNGVIPASWRRISPVE
ncbi:MAG: GGDEF domain-containing protein [Deltaproteobacteria bacterium]|nr:GGDEF domain-containing protein [Deltaproteobacteria bacterium]